jgi:aspartyl-tRNA(Asn)/glutamyl-tRNA(Gln) amidotransferase subunit A
MYDSLAYVQNEIAIGNLSCVTLVRYFLKKIEDKKQLNAFLEVFSEEAIQRAISLDQKKENKGKLFGLVVAIKDNICYKDHKVSAASKILNGFVSIYSSTLVERLLAEDAIIIGRTNCDEFAMGSSNENSAFGNVLNHADETRVSGGSSGGSAVAVQAKLCMASFGSDTGGSIRQPAAFCGVIGYKPSYGVVSRYGLIAYASSFDQIGPLTNNIDDLRRIMEVISGADQYDATMSTHKIPFATKGASKKMKIAYFNEILNSAGMEDEVTLAVRAKIEELKADGHTVEPVEFKYLDYLIPAYYVLSTAEASSNLARFDGIHYGYRSPIAKNIDEVYKKSRSEGFGKEVKNRIMLGTFVLSAGYYDAYYGKAQKLRRLLQDNLKQIFSDYDFILTPTSPTTAFKFGEKGSDPIAMYLADIFTVLSNLTGTPAISLPLATSSKNNMPIGIQLMAASMQDEKLLDFSEALMKE